ALHLYFRRPGRRRPCRTARDFRVAAGDARGFPCGDAQFRLRRDSMTEASARFALPMLLPGQAQKELFHNEALTVIDTALHPTVAGIVSDPPGAPDVGASWIVGVAAT